MTNRIRHLTIPEILLIAEAAKQAANDVRQHPAMPWSDPAWLESQADIGHSHWITTCSTEGQAYYRGELEHYRLVYCRAAMSSALRPLAFPACELWCGCQCQDFDEAILRTDQDCTLWSYPIRPTIPDIGTSVLCYEHGLTIVFRIGIPGGAA